MRVIAKILKVLAALVLAAVVGLAGWLYFAPPELIRVGSAYSAKIVCSNVFLAGRDPSQVLSEDVQAPGHPLLRFIRISVDDARKSVTARIVLGMKTPEEAMASLVKRVQPLLPA